MGLFIVANKSLPCANFFYHTGSSIASTWRKNTPSPPYRLYNVSTLSVWVSIGIDPPAECGLSSTFQACHCISGSLEFAAVAAMQ